MITMSSERTKRLICYIWTCYLLCSHRHGDRFLLLYLKHMTPSSSFSSNINIIIYLPAALYSSFIFCLSSIFPSQSLCFIPIIRNLHFFLSATCRGVDLQVGGDCRCHNDTLGLLKGLVSYKSDYRVRSYADKSVLLSLRHQRQLNLDPVQSIMPPKVRPTSFLSKNHASY